MDFKFNQQRRNCPKNFNPICCWCCQSHWCEEEMDFCDDNEKKERKIEKIDCDCHSGKNNMHNNNFDKGHICSICIRCW